MQRHAQLTPEWRDWIIENLARGCAPEALVADMVGRGFDPAFARASIVRHAPGAVAVESGAALSPAAAFVAETPRIPPGNVIRTHDRAVHVGMRLARPIVVVLRDVLSQEECAELIRRSAAKLARSTTVDPQDGSYKVDAGRTSHGTYFPRGDDTFIANVEQRLATIMGMPVENGEGLQILHYLVGGEYRPHFDYFPPDNPGSAASLAKGGQRVSTMVMYLNEVEGGGATGFPELGLEVAPQPGTAVYFEYCNRRGQVDPLTLHAGMPVTAGEKWIMTKWVRERRYG